MTSPITADTASAQKILEDQLRKWGIPELVKDLGALIKQGLDAPAIIVELSNSEAYKKRFAGNEERRKKGLPVLAPGEYIAAENSYQTVLRTYGLPANFYDQRSDFTQFIANDVSPDELNERAGIAQQVWLSKDETTKGVWRSFYGLTDGAAIASILDPGKALPVVQRMSNASRFGAEAVRQGLAADKGRLETYSDLGLTQDAVAQGFARIGQTQGANEKIAQRFGQTFGQAEAEAATLTGTASAQRKLSQLQQNEQALFESKAAAESGALSRTRSGRF